jgi:hypothetical protein
MGFPGPAQQSPWVQEFVDYLGRKVIITIVFNNANRNISSGSIHRDAQCRFHTIVFGDPSDVNSPRLRAPGQNAIDVSFTAAQILSTSGFSTIEQAMAEQITAEP